MGDYVKPWQENGNKSSLTPLPCYLSQIETGTREGGIVTLKRIAAILRVSIDDIV
jgi:transcriptional regulator with XRE-family HTH domain